MKEDFEMEFWYARDALDIPLGVADKFLMRKKLPEYKSHFMKNIIDFMDEYGYQSKKLGEFIEHDKIDDMRMKK